MAKKFGLKKIISDINLPRKRHLRETDVRRNVTNKMNLMEVQCEDVDCEYFLPDRETCWTYVKTVTNHLLPQRAGISDQLGECCSEERVCFVELVNPALGNSIIFCNIILVCQQDRK